MNTQVQGANKYSRRFVVELRPDEAWFVPFLLHSEKEVHETIMIEMGLVDDRNFSMSEICYGDNGTGY